MILHFSVRLGSWFTKNGRHDLPWQHDRTPYRVWVSEIMLQQTQVASVIPYFQKFIEHFPNLTSLAKADEDEILHLWAGLGYYNRARCLHRTAKIIHDTLKDKFPSDLTELQQLPGIGRSTAVAIRAIAFKKHAVILDGNVKRVLTRLHGITEWTGNKSVKNQLWKLAEQYTPKRKLANYTQAIMDLGATLCTQTRPQCGICPFTPDCKAYQYHLIPLIPAKKPSGKLPLRQSTFLILHYRAQVFLYKRPSAGLWGGLWSLPEFSGHAAEEKIKHFLQTQNLHLYQMKSLPKFLHRFTHFQLDIEPVLIKLSHKPKKIILENPQIWYKIHQPQALGMPSPVHSLVTSLGRLYDSSSTVSETR